MKQRTDRDSADSANTTGRWRWINVAWAMLWLVMLTCLMAQPHVFADQGTLPQFIADPAPDPLVHSDAVFFARKVDVWEQDGASWLLLEGDARFSIGVYGFKADAAVVRIDTESRPGKTIRHLSIYLDNARHLRGQGPVSADAKRLFVTVSTLGGVQVHNDLFVQLDQPPRNDLLDDAKSRMRRQQEALARISIKPSGLAQVEPTVTPTVTPVTPDATVTAEPKRTEPKAGQVAPEPTVAVDDDNVLPTHGTVSLGADRVVYDPPSEAQPEASVMLIGNVRVFYDDYRKKRQVSLRAERMVVFLNEDEDAGPVAPSAVDAASIRGIYLEDNVIVTDADFTVRAPRVYYDVRDNKAVLLEAVVYSYDAMRKLPLYMRAQTVRQTSANSFNAEGVQLTTSEFAEPHFAIGAGKLTLDRVQTDGEETYQFSATDTTLRVKDTPFFLWPYFEGELADIPLKRVKAGYDSDRGPEIETAWDVFALAGEKAPDGVQLLGKADWLGDHGPAVGAELEYAMSNMFGKADAYLLLSDSGDDTIGGRRDIEQDAEVRGYYHWQHRQFLENGSELSVESAYVSDETFLEEFFRDQAYETKQYETSLYWKLHEGDQALTFLTRYDLTDFTPQLTTLQSPGYTVDKAPEIAYYRTGTSLMDDQLTWFSENRAGFVRIRPGEDTPFDRGFSNAASMQLFGIPNTTAFDDALFAAGVPDEWVFRADSRQELNLPLQVGDFNVVPYVVGRVTVYDEDFSAYAGEDEKMRLWGALGTRISTELHKTYDYQNSILDVNGIRHIIEPSIDVFYAKTNIDPGNIPVYDYDVESIRDGGTLRLGLTNTLQTRRGSGKRQRTVDWVVLRTDLVLAEDVPDPNAELARFFEDRPEYSRGGDHIYTELLWMVTDTLGFSGELTHSLEDDRIVQWRIGGTLQHTPRLTSFVRYDEIDLLDSQLLSYGFTYRLTAKYEMGFRQRIDFTRDESRSIDLWLERRVPRWLVRLTARVDEIDDNQSIGITLTPEGF